MNTLATARINQLRNTANRMLDIAYAIRSYTSHEHAQRPIDADDTKRQFIHSSAKSILRSHGINPDTDRDATEAVAFEYFRRAGEAYKEYKAARS